MDRLYLTALLFCVVFFAVVILVQWARIRSLKQRINLMERNYDLVKPARRYEEKPPPVGASDEVLYYLQRGERIEAIKAYREYSGVGLKEAKDYVDELIRQSGKK